MTEIVCPCCGRGLRAPSLPLQGLLSVPLPKAGRRIVEALVKAFPRAVPMAVLLDAVYFDDPEGGPATADNVVRVAMIRVRRELEPLGWTIPRGRFQGRDFLGYRLTPLAAVARRAAA